MRHERDMVRSRERWRPKSRTTRRRQRLLRALDVAIVAVLLPLGAATAASDSLEWGDCETAVTMPSPSPVQGPAAISGSSEAAASPAPHGSSEAVVPHDHLALERLLPPRLLDRALTTMSVRGTDMGDETLLTTAFVLLAGGDGDDLSIAYSIADGDLYGPTVFAVFGRSGDDLIRPYMKLFGAGFVAADVGPPPVCAWGELNGRRALLVRGDWNVALVPLDQALIVLRSLRMEQLRDMLDETTRHLIELGVD